MRERVRKRTHTVQYTGLVKFYVLHLGTELVKYTDETSTKIDTKKIEKEKKNGD